MGMLRERADESLDTLSAERMAVEATFRHTGVDGTQWIYHVSLYGEDTAGLDVSNPVEREHVAYAQPLEEARLEGPTTGADAGASSDQIDGVLRPRGTGAPGATE